MAVRYDTAQFLLRGTVCWYGTCSRYPWVHLMVPVQFVGTVHLLIRVRFVGTVRLFCNGTVRWYGAPYFVMMRVRYVGTLFESKILDF